MWSVSCYDLRDLWETKVAMAEVLRTLARFAAFLLIIPVMAGLMASLAYRGQGGFGGGHGGSDFVICMLGMPAFLLVERLATTGFFTGIASDYVLVVLIPAVLNVVFWVSPACFFWLLSLAFKRNDPEPPSRRLSHRSH